MKSLFLLGIFLSAANARELKFHFDTHTNSTCDATSYSTVEGSRVLDCQIECDSAEQCSAVTFNGTHCDLHQAVEITPSVLDLSTCLVKAYVAPTFFYDNFTGTQCFGDVEPIMTVEESSNLQCRSLCNTIPECEAFNLYVLESVCELIAQYNGGFPESEISNCYPRNRFTVGQYYGPFGTHCGSATPVVETNVEYGIHSCYLGCSGRDDCYGFMYDDTDDSCEYYSTVDVVSQSGSICYQRTIEKDIESVDNKVLNRISINKHGFEIVEPGFSNYMKTKLENYIDSNVTIDRAYYNTSVVGIDYLVDLPVDALFDAHDMYDLIREILGDGIYDLGDDFVIGSDPIDGVSPTMQPTMIPPTSPPTLKPKKGISAVFANVSNGIETFAIFMWVFAAMFFSFAIFKLSMASIVPY